MPHIIVEYARQALNEQQVIHVLDTIHAAVVDSGLFDASHIKTRAYPFYLMTLAGGSEPYIHIQVRIKSGRDAANKKHLAEVIMSSLMLLDIDASVVTLEVIDMDRDSYTKFKPV